MKLLKHIEDKPLPQDKRFEKRAAARAVLFDGNSLIPILFVSKFNYHKLPGGGIEDGEGKLKALDREILEETGCKAKINSEVGKITEYRSEFNLYQTSFCYLGKVIGKGAPRFEQGEIDEGFQLVWLSHKDAILQLKKDKPSNYEGKFIRERDPRFLEESEKIRA